MPTVEELDVITRIPLETLPSDVCYNAIMRFCKSLQECEYQGIGKPDVVGLMEDGFNMTREQAESIDAAVLWAIGTWTANNLSKAISGTGLPRMFERQLEILVGRFAASLGLPMDQIQETERNKSNGQN